MQKAKQRHMEFKQEEVTPIENCSNVECPISWEDLPLEKEGVRKCGKCGKSVPMLKEPPPEVMAASATRPDVPFAIAKAKEKDEKPPEVILYSQRSTGSVVLGNASTPFGGGCGCGFYWGQSLHSKRLF